MLSLKLFVGGSRAAHGAARLMSIMMRRNVSLGRCRPSRLAQRLAWSAAVR
jgi:hypothetical protein